MDTVQSAKLETPRYTFKVGDSIDARNKHGIWNASKIVDILNRKKADPNAVYGYIKVCFSANNTSKIQISTLNICFCDEYCLNFHPDRVTWSNHIVAAANTQSKIQRDFWGIESDTYMQKIPTFPQSVKKPLHYKFIVVVFGFVRNYYEELCSKSVPTEIKHMIFMFWDYVSSLAIRDSLRIKTDEGFWKEAFIKGITRNQFNHTTSVEIQFVHCLNIVNVGDTIDAKDRDGKWYLARVNAIKPAKKKFPVNAPSKKKKKLKKLAGIYVHFVEFGNRFNEWIFVKDGVLCDCCIECDQSEHRITFPRSQSDKNPAYTEFETLDITNSSFCDCIDKCNEGYHRLRFTENYPLVRSSTTFCFF